MHALDALLASGTDPITVPLAGVNIRVKPVLDWQDDALEYLMSGQFRSWASTSLVNDLNVVDGVTTGSDDFELWKAAKPSLRQVVQFVTDYSNNAGGLDLGKSQTSLS